MKLWLLSQDVNDEYDTYDSCVVVAITEDNAKQIHPDGCSVFKRDIDSWTGDEQTAWFTKGCFGKWFVGSANHVWCSKPSNVMATYIGEAAEELVAGTVVCASFNA